MKNFKKVNINIDVYKYLINNVPFNLSISKKLILTTYTLVVNVFQKILIFAKIELK